MKEVWKSVSLNADYEVSNTGRVRRIIRTLHKADTASFYVVTFRYLKLNPRRNGHVIARLKDKNGVYQSVMLGQLVAQAFVPNEGDAKYVHHLDGNVSNNDCRNLVWAFSKSSNQKLCKRIAKCHKITGKILAVYNSLKEAVYKNHLDSPTGISHALRGELYTSAGFQWKYV